MDKQQEMTAFLGLGGNLGDPLGAFLRSRQKLWNHPTTSFCRSSPLYKTPPLGGPSGQPDYLNAVLMLKTTLPPQELLFFCQTLELAEGREHKEHWGARTLDIDLLLYGEQQINETALTLPHPRMTERHFVLLPLVSLAADLLHPVAKMSMQELLDQLPAAKNIQLLSQNW